MSKNNRGTVRPAVLSPVASEVRPSAATALGAPGYARDLQSELFLLAACNLPGEKAFHEGTDARVTRFRDLVREASATVPDWTAALLPYLRGPGNLRLAPVEAAAEYAWARRDEAGTGREAVNPPSVTVRKVVDSVLQRADEPGEVIAYWLARYGRKMPIGFKRGVADAVIRLYSEFSLLKYDTREAAVRFGDVIELVQPRYHSKEYGTWRDALYKYAIERRHNRDNPIPEPLAMIRANAALNAAAATDPKVLLDTDRLRAAGMTWQNVLSLAGDKVDKSKLWAALAPIMGYDALRKNLRNFDQAGMPDDIAAVVAARLADPEQVAKSRQFPFRFLSAYRAVPSLRWAYPLEQALGASLANVPRLKGRTLVLVDTSTSMNDAFSKDGTLMRWDAAALFGVAVGHRSDQADVVSFSGRNYYHEPQYARTKAFPLQPGESLLRSLERWRSGGWFIGGGTDTALALRAHYAGHDRVVIATDEQAANDGAEVSASVPANVPLYTWNLAGYERGHGPSGMGQRHTFGGLTDGAFRMVSLLESGRDSAWPWLNSPQGDGLEDSR